MCNVRASAYKSIEVSINTHFLTAKAQKAKKEGKTEGCGHKKRIRLRTFGSIRLRGFLS
jgi:hypothetical protein